MIILDTNVLSELMQPSGSQQVKSWVAQHPREMLYTTSISQAEILYGIRILPEGQRRETLMQVAQVMFVEDFASKILSFDRDAAVRFAEIAAHRRRLGQPISQADAEIAAICSVNSAAIATRNVKDFLHCEIAIFNPWNSQPESP